MKKVFTIGLVAAVTALSSAPAVADDVPAAAPTVNDAPSDAPAAEDGPASAEGFGWQPSCRTVNGDGSVTFTRNEGKTITPTSQSLQPVAYTTGLVALDRPNQLLSLSNNLLSKSNDSGCTWTPVSKVTGSHVELVAARGNRAYAWDREGTLALATPEGVTPLTSPAGEMVGLGTDRFRGDHLRVADGDGQLYDSKDGGRTWRRTGAPAWPQSDLLMVYTAAFDPYDLNHVILGGSNTGARVTHDGGRTWTAPKGLSDRVNVFSAKISPAAPNVVYAMGLNLKETGTGVPSDGRHIYRSSDGGRRFTPVVDQGDGITLANGPLLAPHPTDPAVLYFEFGTGWSGLGTDIYRYDARRNRVTSQHNSYDRVTSITFNLMNPQVMYLGVAEEV
ncbi:hypothetical protein ABZ897_23680 [Nonomuraea sp. NPDC046802]|uniref:WD40/YVTN/BNR-like repeat-containing protein n=1 Tax=Nonomuraea sp. NPDC046802 TaxID=3154919 RepID=UPI0033E801CD